MRFGFILQLDFFMLFKNQHLKLRTFESLVCQKAQGMEYLLLQVSY